MTAIVCSFTATENKQQLTHWNQQVFFCSTQTVVIVYRLFVLKLQLGRTVRQKAFGSRNTVNNIKQHLLEVNTHV